MKCDVIIPVYNSPEWVKLCIYSIIKNTEDKIINKIYLINDCSNEITGNLLNNLKDKYKKIEIVNNEENLGFVKTVNKGLKLSKADYVLLLNTDCIIGKNTIKKLINHVEKDKDIGLICPVASNAANISLPMFPGFTYMQMDQLLEKKFLGKCFDACTVVGNCLLITKKCMDKVGYLDEAFGMGYGEETDYQFKAMEAGFKAKVAIDTYVFHKAEASFGTSAAKNERLEKNRKLFFDRWGTEYYKLMEVYQKNDPIKYILNNLSDSDKRAKLGFGIYLIGLVQNAGGVHNTVDMINYLAINNVSCNIVYEMMNEYKEIMLFNPIQALEIKKHKIDKLVSTIYLSTYIVKSITDELDIPLIYYSQGYEAYFENGLNYGIAELSYKISDKVLTISKFLQDRLKNTFNVDSDMIANGINYDLLYKKNDKDKANVLTFVLRNNTLKGDFIALDILKNVYNKFDNLEINILCNNEKLTLPFCNNKTIKINKLTGNFSRLEIAQILQKTDIYIDTSLTEGFGLMALEAMTAGAVVVVSDSGGINEYIDDEKNGFIIREVTNVSDYVSKIDTILNDKDKYRELKKECIKTIKKFDYDKIVDQYINYFGKKVNKKKIELTDDEKNLYSYVLDTKFKISVNSRSKSLIYKLCRKIPKGIRISIKNFVEKLYKFTNER